MESRKLLLLFFLSNDEPGGGQPYEIEIVVALILDTLEPFHCISMLFELEEFRVEFITKMYLLITFCVFYMI